MGARPTNDDELAWVAWLRGEIKTRMLKDFFSKTQTDIIDVLDRDKANFTTVYPHADAIIIMQTYALAMLIRECLIDFSPSPLAGVLNALVRDTLAGKLDPPS